MLLQEEENLNIKTRTPCKDRRRTARSNGGRFLSDTPTNQGRPGINSHQQRLGRDKEGFSPKSFFQRMAQLWDNTFLLFQAPQFVVLCYSSPWKLIQTENRHEALNTEIFNMLTPSLVILILSVKFWPHAATYCEWRRKGEGVSSRPVVRGKITMPGSQTLEIKYSSQGKWEWCWEDQRDIRQLGTVRQGGGCFRSFPVILRLFWRGHFLTWTF